MNQQLLAELKNILKEGRILFDEPMKKHTTFRVGGSADVLILPEGDEICEVIKCCRKYDEPYDIVGNGSNLLVSDKGIRGLVIAMVSRRQTPKVEEQMITAGAGMLLSKVANEAAKAGLAGMEFAAGIPGSIGGAVVMNAGAYGGEMKDIIKSVTVVDETGEKKRLTVQELELGYRTSCIKKNKYVVIEAELRLQQGTEIEIRARMEELRQKRLEKQPLEYPSAGSTFKRPEGYFAGKLIMDAGLRGYQVGGAQVSEKHCGFVINKGDATAADIVTLMKNVSEKVEMQFGVRLEPELKMLGEFGSDK